MKIIPMPAEFGAQIEDVRLNQPNDQLKDGLRAALLEHGMLVIRGQQLSPQAQVDASAIFGRLETFPAAPGQIADFPQIFRVASRAADGHTNVGRYWHSDGSFRAVPTPISLWYSEAQAEQGGDTLFTDLQSAYRTLPDELKQVIAPLRTVHRNGIVHPLLMPHPATGVPGLYLNSGLTAGIFGMAQQESVLIMNVIDAHFSRDDAVYRHQWQLGDFVVADNFHVAHRATHISPEQRRILNRTTVAGGRAFWNSQDGQEHVDA
jgi:taurine dioxygenase